MIRSDVVDEEWVTRARFQYCDMGNGQTSDGSRTFHHAFSSLLCGIDTMVSGSVWNPESS